MLQFYCEQLAIALKRLAIRLPIGMQWGAGNWRS